MDSLDNGIYDQKINLYSQLACCYVKLGQSAKAKEVAQKAREYCWQVLAVDSSVRIHQVFINSFACIKDAYVRVKDWDEVRSWMAINDSVGKFFFIGAILMHGYGLSIWPIPILTLLSSCGAWEIRTLPPSSSTSSRIPNTFSLLLEFFSPTTT